MKISRRSFIAMMAAAGAAPLHAAEMPEPLKVLGKRKGINIGNAIGGGYFRDPAYKALMARECNMLVAENEGKWQALEPRQGQYNFGPADAMYSWAREQGMLVRGHNLIWQEPKWLPKWVNEYDFGAQPGKAAEALLRKHIVTVCDHFGSGIHSYDVVNEAVDPKTGNLHANVFTERMGGAVEQIDFAFRLAHERAPKVQLVYNDYMREDVGTAKHRAGVLKLLHDLKARGTPIHALGLQSHIGAWDDSSNANGQQEWRKFLDEVTGMGLDLLITEFDVNDRKLPADVKVRDAGVAALAKDYLDVTLSYRQCRDFLLWGMAHHTSWLQGWEEAKRTDGLKGRPTPFDDQLRAKPLRDAIAAAINAAPARS